MLRSLALITVLALAVVTSLPAGADEPKEKIQVAILTGQNNHAWFKDTPVLKNILDEAGLFETTILQSPDVNDPDKASKWEAFNPDFDRFDVVVLNYNNKIPNGDELPERVKQAFVAFIKEGGAAYSFHAGNNASRGWTEYEQMIGLLWRPADYGKRVFFDDQGQQQVMQPGEGPGAGHGRQHAYRVDTRVPDHPVFKDLPRQWMHAKDELYHGQRGPAENMTVLLTAYNDPAVGGTGVSEPIVWTIPFGKGTVMTNVMGHWWPSGKGGGESLQCVGFQTLFTRSIEWLATDKVTIAKPEDFPTKDKTSMRDLKPFEPLAYIFVPGVPGSDPLAGCDHCSPQTEPGFVPVWRQFAEMQLPVPGETIVER